MTFDWGLAPISRENVPHHAPGVCGEIGACPRLGDAANWGTGTNFLGALPVVEPNGIVGNWSQSPGSR
jgi:hypothetical protein